MSDQTQGPLIFHTRRGALIALCIGILLTLRNFRYLFELCVPGHKSWLTRYHFPPTHFSIILDLWCAVLFAGALILILRRSRGSERVYLALFLSTVVLAPIKYISSVASVHAYTWLATILELGLIPSAIWMYKVLPPRILKSEAE
jgi:hypothetical protein